MALLWSKDDDNHNDSREESLEHSSDKIVSLSELLKTTGLIPVLFRTAYERHKNAALK